MHIGYFCKKVVDNPHDQEASQCDLARHWSKVVLCSEYAVLFLLEDPFGADALPIVRWVVDSFLSPKAVSNHLLKL